MKKLLSLVLLAMMLISVMPGFALANVSADTSWYTGHESDTEYKLYDEADLKGLADLVNGGNSFTGKTFILQNNITISSDNIFSIGKSKTTPFAGKFNGNNKTITYTISELYQDDGDPVGNTLFGYITGTNTNLAEIHDLNINASVYLSGHSFLKKDMLAALAIGTQNAKISNITTTAVTWDLLTDITSISERLYIGGISVYDYGRCVYENCTNNIGLTIKNFIFTNWNAYTNFGGIVSRCEFQSGYSTYINCINNGSLYQENPYDINMAGKAAGYYAQRIIYGGIIGQLNYADKYYHVLVLDCKNNGTCTAGGNNYWNGSSWQNADSGNQGSRGYFAGYRWVSSGANGYQKYGIDGTADWVGDFTNTICWGQNYTIEETPVNLSTVNDSYLSKYTESNATFKTESHNFVYNNGSTSIILNSNTDHAEYFKKLSDCVKLVGTYGGDNPNGPVVIFGKVAKPVAQIGATKYTSLQQALNAAISGDTVELLSDIEISSGLSLSKAGTYTIDGNGYKISQKKGSTISDSALFLGDSISNLNSGKKYILKDTTFVGFSGAIDVLRIESCTATVTNCTFASNTNVNNTRGSNQILLTNVNANVTGCTFKNNNCGRIVDFNTNTAEGALTGNILFENNLIKNNTVNNTALVYAYGPAGMIKDNTFMGNTVNSSAAACVYLSGACNIYNNLFYKNSITGTGSGQKVGVVAIGSGAASSKIKNNGFDSNTLAASVSNCAIVYVGANNIDLTDNYWNDGNSPETGDKKDIYISSSKTGILYDTYATGYSKNAERNGVKILIGEEKQGKNTNVNVMETVSDNEVNVSNEQTKEAIEEVIDNSKVTGVSDALTKEAEIALANATGYTSSSSKDIDISVSVKVNVTAAADVVIKATETNTTGSIVFSVKPVASVIITDPSTHEIISEKAEIAVTNDMLSGNMIVTLPVLDIKPVQVVHTCDDGTQEVFTNSNNGSYSYANKTFGYDSVNKTVTLTITKFSTLAVYGTEKVKISNTTVESGAIATDKKLPAINIGVHNNIIVHVDDCIYEVNDSSSEAIASIFIENGRTFLGVRDMAYALGIDPMAIKWDDKTKTATISKSGASVAITQGSTDIKVTYGGYVYTVKSDASAQIKNDRIYLPFRVIFQIFGYTVDWDGTTRTITCK